MTSTTTSARDLDDDIRWACQVDDVDTVGDWPQFERRLIQERTRAGLEAARARGRLGGRKPIPVDDPRVQMAKKMHSDKSMSVQDTLDEIRLARS